MATEVSDSARQCTDGARDGVTTWRKPNGFTGDTIFLHGKVEPSIRELGEAVQRDGHTREFPDPNPELEIAQGERMGPFGCIEVLSWAKEIEKTDPDEISNRQVLAAAVLEG
jgi:hypothetical protein